LDAGATRTGAAARLKSSTRRSRSGGGRSLLGERGTLLETTRVAPISLRKPNYLALQRNGSAMRSAVRDFT
jgi:hypothetical protein